MRLSSTFIKASLLLIALSVNAAGQSSEASRQQQQQGALQAEERAGATADETFDLNIEHRRIVEENFAASTEVEAGGDRSALSLRVGVAVRAREIEVVLRNVQGRVRFRASLAPVLRLFEGRGAAAPSSTVEPIQSP